MSKKYSLNREDAYKIGQTILYTVASAIISTLIVVVGEMDFGAYAFLIPLINTMLYSAKKFLEERV